LKHSILFENCDNHWDNALPLGNGCFGAMLYYEDEQLHMPMNHYEIYYNIAKHVTPENLLKIYQPVPDPGGRFGRFKAQAIGNLPKEGELFCNYDFKREKAFDKSLIKIDRFSGSYPPTGELSFAFSDSVTSDEQKLILYIEDAKTRLTLSHDEHALSLSTIVARKDCIISHVKQTTPGLLTSIEIGLSPQRDLKYPQVAYRQINENTFTYTVTRHFDAESAFTFSGVVKLIGAAGTLVENEYSATVNLKSAQNEVYILTGVFSDWNYQNTQEEGVAKIEEFASSVSTLYEEHKSYWNKFFSRSSISIPDTFLENVYYINQYALDCSSGKDGVMKHHACGLNGLWDIKHPNLWGSMWYWDVNIQAAFAGVFSSNRLDLAKVFSDGLRSYEKLAEKFAYDVHAITGLAGDYPHCCYYSQWAWCAQYLWFLYEYSLDKAYLKNEAFPLFVKLCDYYLQVFHFDEEKGYYSIFPDVSPEQGPFAHDTVITVACVKYLLQFTLKSAEILKIDLKREAEYRHMMEHLAPYPISNEGTFGKHVKDSADAPDNMWIRHPSLLMPLFPIGEFDLESSPEWVAYWSNSIDFLDERTELGVFQSSWIAAAAARLGRGQTALRLLYERGIDHMLRTNGLTAEETERFINHCLVPRQPLYYPCMMEYTGEMLAAVNEMLLQSHNGIVRVFPALPDGDMEYGRLQRHGYPINEFDDRFTTYKAWTTLHFESLLAKGAFLISASLTEGKLDYIKVESQKGGTIRITSPYLTAEYQVYAEKVAIPIKHEGTLISFETEPGTTYVISNQAQHVVQNNELQTYHPEVLSRESYLKRHIFLGENPESVYQKAVDGFIRDWYVGNVRMENHTVYKFDFTNKAEKPYETCMTRHTFSAEERTHIALPFVQIGSETPPFSIYQGFGFNNNDSVQIAAPGGPDILRQDFAEGTEEVEFLIDAPRGQYELFVVSGDSNSASVTTLEVVNGRKTEGELLPAGKFQCKVLPLVNEKDGNIRLKISTKQGYKWKLNYMMLNAVKGY